MKRTWSVIVCSINAGKFAEVVQCYERLLAGRQFEIIGIHDAVSLSEGYNRGIQRSRGDVIVFSHDDILIVDQQFADKVERRLDGDFQLLGFAGAAHLTDGYWWSAGLQHMRGVVAHAIPAGRQISLHVYGVTESEVERVQALDGLCLIASREAVDALTFDAAAFDGFHLYDLDFSFSAHLRGLRVGAMTDVAIIHMSPGTFGTEWKHFRQRFARKHADKLGLDASARLPEPRAIQARVAMFDDVAALLQVWRPEHLRRASIALRRDV